MNVVITGANSAVGQAILRCGTASLAPSITLIAAVRSSRAAEEVQPLLGESSSVVRISYDDPASLHTAFQEASAVIHLPGILFERPGSTYEQANVRTSRSVVEAAKQSGVKKIVLVSAIGADKESSNGYWRTKGQAEDLVRASGLSYTVLRAPLLLGPITEGGAALRRNATLPKIRMIGGGRNLQQPLHVDDLARAAIIAAHNSVADNRTLDLVGPISLPDREIVERASRLKGRQIQVRTIPKKVALFAVAIRQRIGRGGFSLDVLNVITANTSLDPRPAASELGIDLTGLEEMIKSSLELRTI
jgi:uncharacterized protein YbjT (DUF2867 family)